VIGVSFDPPARNAQFRQNEGFAYDLWTDTGRELALYYGAATSASAPLASRVTTLLDADGTWLLVYYPGGLAGLYAHAGQVLADCQALSGQ
jgi:peroxiredoxin